MKRPALWLFFWALTFLLSAGEPPQLPQIPSEFWRARDVLSLEVEALADVFLFGRDEAEIDGVYHQDVWAAGRRVLFRGRAADDVRLAAVEMLEFDGQIEGGSLRALSGRNMMVNTNALIRGPVWVRAGQTLTLAGDITGDVEAAAANMIVDARIDGDLTVHGGDMVFLPGSRITGTLYYSGERGPTVPAGILDGDPVRLSDGDAPAPAASNTGWMIRAVQVFTAWMIGLFLVRFLPRFSGHCVESVLRMHPQCFFLGMMTLLLLGGSAYLMLVSVLGLGVGVFLLLTLTGLFYCGKIVIALALGTLLLRGDRGVTLFRLMGSLLAGLLVLYGLFSLPVVGASLWFLASVWGMGALVHGIRSSQRVLKLEIPATESNTVERNS